MIGRRQAVSGAKLKGPVLVLYVASNNSTVGSYGCCIYILVELAWNFEKSRVLVSQTQAYSVDSLSLWELCTAQDNRGETRVE